MLTIGKLKELINQPGVSDDTEIRWCDGSHIINIAVYNDMLVLSDHPVIGFCMKCGDNAYKEKVEGEYSGYCLSCDENLYAFEIENCSSEEDNEEDLLIEELIEFLQGQQNEVLQKP